MSKPCYQCDRTCKYLFHDGRCSDCTRLTPEEVLGEVECSKDPRAPHGFNRNASHNEDRYVCDCEGWAPDE